MWVYGRRLRWWTPWLVLAGAGMTVCAVLLLEISYSRACEREAVRGLRQARATGILTCQPELGHACSAEETGSLLSNDMRPPAGAQPWALNDIATIRDPSEATLPILIPVCGRPEYLSQVLQHLDRVEGIQETTLVFSQDLSNPRVDALIRQAATRFRVIHLRHTKRFWGIPSLFHFNEEYSTTANIFFLLSFAFNDLKAPGVIMLESDLVPSPDFYRYFQWTFFHFLVKDLHRDPPNRIISINAFRRDSVATSSPFAVWHHHEFFPWGWCTSSTMWPWFKSRFTFFNNWDITIERARKREGLWGVVPELTRTKNIGQHGVNLHLSDKEMLKWEATILSDSTHDFKDPPVLLNHVSNSEQG